MRRRVTNDTFARKATPGGIDFVRKRVTNITFAQKVTPGRLYFVRRRVTNDTFARKVTPNFRRWSTENTEVPVSQPRRFQWATLGG